MGVYCWRRWSDGGDEDQRKATCYCIGRERNSECGRKVGAFASDFLSISIFLRRNIVISSTTRFTSSLSHLLLFLDGLFWTKSSLVLDVISWDSRSLWELSEAANVNTRDDVGNNIMMTLCLYPGLVAAEPTTTKWNKLWLIEFLWLTLHKYCRL